MAPPASNLPQDLIDEVLIRLPAKSIGRFRCVSKPWRSLLSSSKFAKSHRNFHIKSGGTTSIVVSVSPNEEDDESLISPHLLTFTTDGSSKKVTSPIFGRKGIGLYAACHGFVLIGTESGMFVFNPLTLKAMKVPKFKLPKKFEWCADQIGLGYDSSNDDYKVVRLSYYDRYCDRDYDGTYVDVYSLKKRSWSRIVNSPYDHHDMPYPCPVAYVNGRLHWQAWDGNRYVIAAFNLAREEFEEVPPTKGFGEGDGLVAAFGGCFAVDCYMDIWVMKVYGDPESWNKLSINTPDESVVGFVCLSREDELVFREHDDFDHGTEKLVAYSLSTGLWRDIIVGGGVIRSRIGQDGVQPFTECLLSPMEDECL